MRHPLLRATALCALAVLGASALYPQPARGQAMTAVAATSSSSGAIATLRVEDRGSHWYVWADNRLAGPAEVLVDYHEGSNVTSRPSLPARATLPAGGSRVVAMLQAADGGGPTRFRLRMDGVPGHPSTRQEDVEYALPLAATARVDQGFEGAFSHDDDENRYALDFAVPPGTPVLAARDGVVMQVEDRRDSSGSDRRQHAREANFVRILHRDGTMAVYAHLQAGGVLVAPGRQVRTGDRIGLSGNSGYSTGPHLHFAVQANRGMRLESLPFRMSGLPAEPGAQAVEDGLRTRSGP